MAGVGGFFVPYYAYATACKPQRRTFRDLVLAQDLHGAFVCVIFPPGQPRRPDFVLQSLYPMRQNELVPWEV